MYCCNCGKEVGDTDKYCPVCGVEQKKENKKIFEQTETRFERFMRKWMYSKVDEWSEKDLRKSSVFCSIGFLVILVIRIIFEGYAFVDKGFFFGEIILLLSDWFFLSKLGVRGFWKAWGLFLTPVYLLVKAKKTDKKYIWGILFLVIFAIYLLISILTSL